MNLEEQVVSLELAKRLKDLGVKQESLFYWANVKSDGKEWNGIFKGSIRPGEPMEHLAAAFTVAELGEMLPQFTFMPTEDGECGECGQTVKAAKHKVCVYLGCHKGHSMEWIIYYQGEHVSAEKYVYGKTEADARAKMLIYLIDNKLITLDHIMRA